MYSFSVDIHEGAVRIVITQQRGWLYRLLTGQAETIVAEIYQPRGDCLKLAQALFKAANSKRITIG